MGSGAAISGTAGARVSGTAADISAAAARVSAAAIRGDTSGRAISGGVPKRPPRSPRPKCRRRASRRSLCRHRPWPSRPSMKTTRRRRKGRFAIPSFSDSPVSSCCCSAVMGWVLTRGGGDDGGMREGEGELVVQSRPEGAQVKIDGEVKGNTPLTVRLDAGAHVLEVQSGKSEPRVIPLMITAGVQTSQYVELQGVAKTGGARDSQRAGRRAHHHRRPPARHHADDGKRSVARRSHCCPRVGRPKSLTDGPHPGRRHRATVRPDAAMTTMRKREQILIVALRHPDGGRAIGLLAGDRCRSGRHRAPWPRT